MLRPITVFPAFAALCLCGCARQQAGQPPLEVESPDESAAIVARAPTPSLGRTVAVWNEPDNPAPDRIIQSVKEAMVQAGCRIVDDLRCDLLITCEHRIEDTMSGSGFGPGEHVRATYLVPPDVVSRHPPDWTLRRLDIRWPAMIRIIFRTREDPENPPSLREIRITLGKEGIDGPGFNRADLRDLWAVLDSWAASLGPGRRR
jgi:hypothetical protein